MDDAEKTDIDALHEEIVEMTQRWASGKPYDEQQARALRERAILSNHRHYLRTIPVYAELAKEQGVGPEADIATLREHMMFTDDIFKSYDPGWLDDKDFARMNQWLGGIYHERIEFDTSAIRTIDQWIEALMEHGVRVIFSSGSSGRFSFVPRCAQTWHRFARTPSCYFAPLAVKLGVVSGWKGLQLRAALAFFRPFKLAEVLSKRGMPDFDGVFLAFREGHMGTMIVAQEFAKRFRKSAFMYEFALSASALRLATRGPKDAEDERILVDFHANTVGAKDAAFDRLVEQLKASTADGQKVFLSGPPYLFKDLAAYVLSKHGSIPLREGSFMMTGGGWKTFSGEMIPQEALGSMIQEAFAVPARLVVDGYSMSEIHGVVPRCEHGRYHIPPLFEPMLFDEDLRPVPAGGVEGTFGFLDPFAISYPGFLISGDAVKMATGPCACGVHGPAFLKIGRATRNEVKGCAGVMAAIQA
jgi:hypothetical protein